MSQDYLLVSWIEEHVQSVLLQRVKMSSSSIADEMERTITNDSAHQCSAPQESNALQSHCGRDAPWLISLRVTPHLYCSAVRFRHAHNPKDQTMNAGQGCGVVRGDSAPCLTPAKVCSRFSMSAGRAGAKTLIVVQQCQRQTRDLQQVL